MNNTDLAIRNTTTPKTETQKYQKKSFEWLEAGEWSSIRSALTNPGAGGRYSENGH